MNATMLSDAQSAQELVSQTLPDQISLDTPPERETPSFRVTANTARATVL